MSERLVTIATFHDPVAASLAKNFLDSEFIPAMLMDEATVATDWSLAGAIGGIKLQVPAIHVERAELLLAQIHEEKLADEAAEPAQLTSFSSEEAAEELRTEQEEKAPINILADRIYRAAVFGLILWPLQAYVILLFLQLLGTKGNVSKNRRWKLWVAVILNIPVLVIILFVISLVFGAFSGCDDVPANRWGWQDGPARRFAVKMPGKSVEFGSRLPSRFGELHFVGIQSPPLDLGYIAMVCDCPKSVGRGSVKEALEEISKRLASDQREQLLTQTYTIVGDLHSMEYTIESVERRRRGMLYFRRDTIYLLEVYGPADQLSGQNAERFFQSMRFP